ncbi:MAG: alginate lyase family protein [Alphaproteobacteria bacterium]|nr:alginate lyase family protein [Alphaproteobacteria bacterium]
MLRNVLVVVLLVLPCATAFAQTQLSMPYPKPVYNQSYPLAEARFKCPDLPTTAPRDLVFTGIYSKDDPERDDTNYDNQQEYRRQTQGIVQFENKLLAMTNAYYVAPPDRQAARARCALSWMYSWAGGRALLGTTNYVGISVRHWTLASLASAYGQIRDEPTLDASMASEVKTWLRALALAVVADYDSPSNRRENNLAYWAAWSVTMTGVAINDFSLYQWGLRRAILAIDDIAGDGTLPLEMQRGSKAMLYHQFALTPLVMIAAAAEANGYNLYSLNDGRLDRLAKRVLAGLESPLFFESRTGYAQEGSETLSAGHMAWVEIYNAHAPSYRTRNLLQRYKPMVSRRLGGNMTLLIGGNSAADTDAESDIKILAPAGAEGQ